MALNADPKPGRWILPLVVLAMVAFTFFFVRALPEASPDTTLAAAPDTTQPEGGTTTTTTPGSPGGPIDDATQTYLNDLDAINSELQVLETEMLTVNNGFDADPRTIDYGDAETRLETLVGSAQALVTRLEGLTVPAGMEAAHTALSTALSTASATAGEALSGLRSSDTGAIRKAAVTAFTTAVAEFDTEVLNAKNLAGASA